jgi:hypothetical protein
VCGDPPPCCVESDGVGCSENPVCEDLICGADAWCCDTQWDSFCAADAAAECGECTPPPVCGDAVCEDPENTDNCPVDCGCPPGLIFNPGTGVCEIPPPCCVESDGVGCSENPVCEDLICGADAWCCDTQWDSFCAADAAAECGECTPPPVCGDAVCENPENTNNCPVDCGCPPGTILNPGAGVCELPPPCCGESNDPGCPGNVACTDIVCTLDGFCCDTQWDGLCAAIAVESCGACLASPPPCCLESDGPGCSESPACEGLICGGDEFCCEVQWDGLCAATAATACGECALPPCCLETDGVGCSDNSACEDLICEEDSFCCETQWDEFCAADAAEECGECTLPPCCVESNEVGCSGNPACEDLICEGDDFCCETQWDEFCAATAVEECGECSP